MPGGLQYDNRNFPGLQNVPMKILHFFPFFSFSSQGGTENFVRQLCDAQQRAGHEVAIFCPNTSEQLRVTSENGITVTCFPFPYGTRDVKFLWGKSVHRTVAEFIDLVKAFDPAIIHLHGYHPSYDPYLQPLIRVYKFVLTPHLVNTICPSGTLVREGRDCDGRVDRQRCIRCIQDLEGGRPLLQWFKRNAGNAAMAGSLLYATPVFGSLKLVLSRLNAIRFLSGEVYFDALTPVFSDVLQANGIDGRFISSFRHPVTEPENYSVPGASARPPGKIRFLFAGRLSVDKGCVLLLNAVKQLSKYKNLFALSFAGKVLDQPVMDRIHQLRAEGFDIKYLGELEPEKMVECYREHDYVVFPTPASAGEMFPMVVQEAIRQSVPVIAADIRPCLEVIREGVNGMLFREGDEASLAGRLREVVLGEINIRFTFKEKRSIEDLKMQYYEGLYRKALA